MAPERTARVAERTSFWVLLRDWPFGLEFLGTRDNNDGDDDSNYNSKIVKLMIIGNDNGNDAINNDINNNINQKNLKLTAITIPVDCSSNTNSSNSSSSSSSTGSSGHREFMIRLP